MFIRFDIGKDKWAIRSDEKQFTLSKPVIVFNKEKNENEVVWKDVYFYSNLETLIESIFNFKLRKSSVSTFDGLLKLIKKTKEEICGLYKTDFSSEDLVWLEEVRKSPKNEQPEQLRGKRSKSKKESQKDTVEIKNKTNKKVKIEKRKVLRKTK